jgi:hypothetical protein
MAGGRNHRDALTDAAYERFASLLVAAHHPLDVRPPRTASCRPPKIGNIVMMTVHDIATAIEA